jgi:hypothetical protein
MDIKALADAYADGVDQGIDLAVERIAAALALFGGGHEREILVQVATGQITVEQLAARLRETEKPTSRATH